MSIFTPQDILNLASRDNFLGNTTLDEQIGFIQDQIKDPFNSGRSNYMKRLIKMVDSPDRMDEICAGFIQQIEDRYPGIEIDLSDYNQHLAPLFTAIYKFFIKNAGQMMQIFIREFIYSNKNRKNLVAPFLNNKIPTYPKEQYGKKEYYVLITRLDSIVDDIFEDGVQIKTFIEFIEKSDDAPAYLDRISDAVEQGIIVDNGIVEELYKKFRKSDLYRQAMNKLEMDITTTFIIPYLEESGLIAVRLPPVEEMPEPEDDDEEEDEE